MQKTSLIESFAEVFCFYDLTVCILLSNVLNIVFFLLLIELESA